MARKPKKFVEVSKIDDYIAGSIYDGIIDDAFDANRDIYRLDIKKKKAETKLDFKKRQNKRVKKFVEKYLFIRKDGMDLEIKLIPQQVVLIADILYQRIRNGKKCNRVIIWASRGGGKGVTVAVIIFVLMIYRNKSFLNLAGSLDQGTVVYEYIRNFILHCIPVVKDKLLKKELTRSLELKNGVNGKCIANSDKQVRGKHPPFLIADEACQSDERKDRNLVAAMNTVFSEHDYIVIFLSTFHIPVGIFQEIWDEAEKRGFVKYKWDVFDTAQKCTLPFNCIPIEGEEEKNCDLTEKREERDDDGKLIGFRYLGCKGKCRNTTGYAPIENIFDAKRSNDDGTWYCEFCCERPFAQGPVYNLISVNRCFVPDYLIEFPEEFETEKIVGIDWGFAEQTAIIGPAIMCDGYVGIRDEKYMSREDSSSIFTYLEELQERYGYFQIFADSSHAFLNVELINRGYDVFRDSRTVVPGVIFNKWKEFMIDNCKKYFDKGRIRISREKCPDLWEYLKKYRKDKDGKPVKKMDHGPDAIGCAMMGFPYLDEVFHKDPANIRRGSSVHTFAKNKTKLKVKGPGGAKRIF